MAKMQLNVFANAMSGKAGNAVFAETKQGTEMRPHTIPYNPDTAAQRKVRNQFTRYTAGWSVMTTAQKAVWKDYAAKTKKRDPITGKVFVPQARNLYGGLTTKFYLVNPTGTPPLTPPATSYAGDVITVTATPATAGKITFTASAANTAGNTTELLLQKLASDDRTPMKDGYRTQQYLAFSTPLNILISGLTPAGTRPPIALSTRRQGRKSDSSNSP